MRDERINYVAVGGFVLAMLTVVVVLVILITGRTGRADLYYAVYDNVAGVKYGSKVLYEGFTIGQVEDIQPQPVEGSGQQRFRLALAVRQGWRFPEDSVARIAVSGLLAAVAVDVKGGRSLISLKPGETLRSQSGGNLFAAMADIASEVNNLSQTVLRPLLETINRTVSAFAPLLEQKAPQVLDNLLALSADLAAKEPRIAANVEQATGGLSRVLSEPNTRKLESTIDHVDHAAANIAELTASLHTSKAKVDQLLTQMDKTVSDNSGVLGDTLKDLRFSLQSVSRNIDSVTYNLEGTSRNMNEFSREIRENPSLLIGGTKGRREETR